MPVNPAILRAITKNPGSVLQAMDTLPIPGDLQARLDHVQLAKRAMRVGTTADQYVRPYVDVVADIISQKMPFGDSTKAAMVKAIRSGRVPVHFNDDTWFEGNWLTNTDGSKRQRGYGEMLELAATHGGFAPTKSDWDVVFDDVIKPVLKIVKLAAPFLSLIPGFGTVAAMALSAGASVALGDPIDESVLNGLVAAVPGGPIAQGAAKAGVEVGEGLLHGQKLDEIAVSQFREQARAQGGDEAAQAFDVGVELAKGKELQAAGFQLSAPWLSGSDKEKESTFIDALDRARAEGKNVNTILMAPYRAAFDALSKAQIDTAHKLGAELRKRSDLSTLTVEDVMNASGVSEAVARGALAYASGNDPWVIAALGSVKPTSQSELAKKTMCERYEEAVKLGLPATVTDALKTACEREKFAVTRKALFQSITKKTGDGIVSTDRVTRPDETPSHLPIYLGGAALAVAVVGGIFWWHRLR